MPAWTPAGLLLAGAEQMEAVGLWQGDYWPGCEDGHPYRDGDPCCLLGGLVVGAGFGDDDPADVLAEPAAEQAIEALHAYLQLSALDWPGVQDWSDHPGRRTDEVVAAFRGAAALLACELSAPCSGAPPGDAWSQPGGALRQDDTRRAGSPNHLISRQETSMVEPSTAPPGGASWNR